jgi:hypothetical protein
MVASLERIICFVRLVGWGGWGKCEVLGYFTAWRLPGAGFKAEAGEQAGDGRLAGATTAGSAELATSAIGIQILDQSPLS